MKKVLEGLKFGGFAVASLMISAGAIFLIGLLAKLIWKLFLAGFELW